MKFSPKQWIIAHYNKPVLIIYSVIIIFLIQILFNLLFEAIGMAFEANLVIKQPRDLYEFLILIKSLLLSIILAPLFETFIFQIFLFYIFVDKLKSSNSVFIIVSAVLFGLGHYNGNMDLVIVAITICIVFNYIYAMMKEIAQPKRAFWTIVFIHSIVNTLGILLNLIVS